VHMHACMHLIDNAYVCNLIDDKIMVGSTVDHSHNNQYMTDLHNSVTIPPRETHNLAILAKP
jgi:hypothetical protein